MEPKVCPFISINQPANQSCECDRCALYVHNNCAFVDIAISLAEITASMKEAASDLFDIAANMS